MTERLEIKHEKQATDERLIEIVEQLVDRIPYVATGSLEDILDNINRIDLDQELSDFIYKRDSVDEDSVKSFKLIAGPEDDGSIVLMANIRTQSENANPTSGAMTYTDNEFYWFTIAKDDDQNNTISTEYARRVTTDYAGDKRDVIEKRHGVITEHRLQTLEIYLDIGKFDDAFDSVSVNLLPDDSH